MKFTLPDPTKDYILTASVFIDSTANEFRNYGLHTFIDEQIVCLNKPHGNTVPALTLGPFGKALLNDPEQRYNICLFGSPSIKQEIRDARSAIVGSRVKTPYSVAVAQSDFDIIERRQTELTLNGKFEIPKGTLLKITKIAWYSRRVHKWSSVVSANVVLPDMKKGRLTIPMDLFATMDFDTVDKVIPKGTKTKKSPKSNLTI